jgi:hypothetical protein
MSIKETISVLAVLTVAVVRLKGAAFEIYGRLTRPPNGDNRDGLLERKFSVFFRQGSWSIVTRDESEMFLRRCAIFSPEALVGTQSLAEKLKVPGRSDRVSMYLAGEMSAGTRALLAKYTNGPNKTLQEALLGDLNRLIERGPIYETQRFAKVKLSEETRRLLASNPRGWSLVRLNRFLLEDAFPFELHRKSFDRLVREVAFDGSGVIYQTTRYTEGGVDVAEIERHSVPVDPCDSLVPCIWLALASCDYFAGVKDDMLIPVLSPSASVLFNPDLKVPGKFSLSASSPHLPERVEFFGHDGIWGINSYQATSTTNVGGLTFPLRSVFRASKGAPVLELLTDRILPYCDRTNFLPQIQGRVTVVDRRLLREDPRAGKVVYELPGRWTSEQELKVIRDRQERQRSAPQRSAALRRVLSWGVLLFLAAPLVYVAIRGRRPARANPSR